MLPERKPEISRANAWFAILAAMPVLYFVTANQVVSESGGLASQAILLPMLLVLSIASASSVGFIVYFQTDQKFKASMERRFPSEGAYQVFRLSSVLSEASAIYGFLLTILFGSLNYVLGFSVLTWVLLVWVRMRFSSNFRGTSDAPRATIQ